MNHKGVEYTVARSEPGVWHWRFRLGEVVKIGRTETNLELLAIRRAQLQINRALMTIYREEIPEDSAHVQTL
jgi:hypothetical protein